MHDHLDRIINLSRSLENLLSNVFAALGTFSLSNQTLCDALVTEGVAADGDTAGDDEVHADRTRQSFDFLHGAVGSLLLSHQVSL